jgi:hypothetical protein
MTRSDIEAYWELANLVKQAADEEGIDLDALAEEMDEEELAEFLDAAMEGALEGAEDENEYSPFIEKTAALLEKVAQNEWIEKLPGPAKDVVKSMTPEQQQVAKALYEKGLLMGAGSQTEKGLWQTLKEMLSHAAERHPFIKKYGPIGLGMGLGAGGLALYERHKDQS